MKLEEKVQKGRELISNKRYREAIAILAEAVKDFPKSSKCHYWLAEALIAQGEADGAIGLLRSAVELAPASFVIRRRLCQILRTQMRIEESIEVIKKGLEVDANNPDILFEIGLSLSHGKRWAEAIEYFQKSIALRKDFSAAYCKLGNALAIVGEKDEAIQNLSKAIQLDPLMSQAHHRLGDLLQAKGLIASSIEHYEKAIEIEPDNYWSHFNLGNALEKQGSIERAKNAYKRAIDINPNVTKAHCNLGYVFSNLGMKQHAIKSFRKSSKLLSSATNPKFVQEKWIDTPLNNLRFIIIGSMKCGTTSLYEYFSGHTYFVPSIRKEIDFFSLRYSQGIDWYKAHFPPIQESSKPFFTGEASTSYLDCPNVANRIRKHFSAVKLIVLLRNPIERAYSHYHHNRRFHPGQETRSFEEAIDQEISLLSSINKIEDLVTEGNQDYFERIRKGYIYRGLYFYFLNDWMSVFPREQFLILKSEDFYSDVRVTVEKVFDFICVSDHAKYTFQKHNAGSYKTRMSKTAERKLENFFMPHNNKLRKILNIPISW